MIPLNYKDKKFQQFMTAELLLTDKAEFTSCSIFWGSSFSDRCIGIIRDRGMTSILMKGTYEITGTFPCRNFP